MAEADAMYAAQLEKARRDAAELQVRSQPQKAAKRRARTLDDMIDAPQAANNTSAPRFARRARTALMFTVMGAVIALAGERLAYSAKSEKVIVAADPAEMIHELAGTISTGEIVVSDRAQLSRLDASIENLRSAATAVVAGADTADGAAFVSQLHSGAMRIEMGEAVMLLPPGGTPVPLSFTRSHGQIFGGYLNQQYVTASVGQSLGGTEILPEGCDVSVTRVAPEQFAVVLLSCN